jgi:hypothetical protein
MKKRWSWLFVLLFPLSPVLHFIAGNHTLSTPVQSVAVIGIAVAVSVLLFLLMKRLLESVSAAAAAAAVTAFLLFSNVHVRQLLVAAGFAPQDSTRLVFQVPWHLMLAAAAFFSYRWVKRKPERLTALTFSAVVLLLFPIAGIIGDQLRAPAVPEETHGASRAEVAQQGQHPHVFVLVLDEYARGDILLDRFGFDNTPFLDALRERGFTVAERSRSNYTQTLLSMTALFSMQLLEGSPPPLDSAGAAQDTRGAAKEEPWNIFNGMRNREAFTRAAVWDIFSRMGYRSVVTDSYPFMIKQDADVVLSGTMSDRLFVDLFLRSTSWLLAGKLLQLIGFRSEAVTREDWIAQIQQNLDYTVQFAAQQQPVLMFTHVICPHIPFVLGIPDSLDADDIYRRSDGDQLPISGYRAHYPRQVDALNTRVLRTVDGILAGGRPVIILLMSDHGSRLHYGPHDIAGTDLDERSANLFAIYSTSGATATFPPDITLVNVFPRILNTCFGGRYPLAEDRIFYSTHDAPMTLTEITDRVR